MESLEQTLIDAGYIIDYSHLAGFIMVAINMSKDFDAPTSVPVSGGPLQIKDITSLLQHIAKTSSLNSPISHKYIGTRIKNHSVIKKINRSQFRSLIEILHYALQAIPYLLPTEYMSRPDKPP